LTRMLVNLRFGLISSVVRHSITRMDMGDGKVRHLGENARNFLSSTLPADHYLPVKGPDSRCYPDKIDPLRKTGSIDPYLSGIIV